MTFPLFLMVALGGMVGAPSRYLLDRAVTNRTVSDFPWGTLAVNLSGCLLLGLLTGLALDHHLAALPRALGATGFCGAYTTFSTFTFETVQLVERGRLREALANTLVSVVVGLAAAAGGLYLGLAL